MKKELIKLLLTGAAAATFGIASGQAATLDDVSGEVEFKFIGYDASQVTYDTSAIADGADLCTTIATCDTASAITGTAAAPGAVGADDSYGITRVNSIVDVATLGNLWSDGDDGDVLLTYFSGFTDFKVKRQSATTLEIFSVGGSVDIFRIDAATFAGLDLTDQSTIVADLVGLSLYLHLDFMTGCDVVEVTATLCGDFDSTTFTGNSSALATATAGTALAKYPNQFFFTQDVVPCTTQPLCSPNGTSFNIFIRGGEATTTTAVPEPATLALLGLGLIGIGLVGRRRRK